ncbi:4-hydroxy-3-methylbut-2-enyl diphosphate reductase [Patescibacteria group bacterium]
MKLILAQPRGFCAGVDRAIDVVEIMLRSVGAPIYVKHEIVHNQHVVKGFEKRGVKFIEDPNDVPEGSVLIFSAHGISPEIRNKAATRKLRVIDATCPLVTKVHIEAARYAKEGYSIILVGHRGHVEMDGTIGEAPEVTQLIESVEEVDSLTVPDPNKVVYLTQTTLSVDDTAAVIKAIKNKFPNIKEPVKEDICYATTNRQAAVKELARQTELVLVVGSPQSSNSNRLREVAEATGTKSYLVPSVEDMQTDWIKNINTIGITSGASTPEDVVQEVIKWLQDHGGQPPQVLKVTEENVYFTLPHELKDQGISTAEVDEVVKKHQIKSSDKLYTKK